MATSGRIAYVRVSSVDQNTARQLEGVQGVGVDKVFQDHCSGKDTNRPQLQLCLEFLREGDTLVCWSMDRLGRSVMDLLNIVDDLTKRGVTVQFIKENLSFTGDDSPMSKLMLTIFAAFADFERSVIRERQREGIAIAKKNGVYTGRKPKLSPAQAEELRRRAEAGEKKSALADEYGISRQRVYAYLPKEQASEVTA